MIDVGSLPHDLQELIFTFYVNGVRERLQLHHHVTRTCGVGSSYWLDWLAHALQYPSVKPHHGVALVGDPTGRANLVDMLQHLLPTCRGHETVQRSWMLHPLLERALAVIVYEPTPRLKSELATLLVEKTVTIRRPSQPVRIVRSSHRMVILPGRYMPSFGDRMVTIQCEPQTQQLSGLEIQALKTMLLRRSVPEFM